MIAGVRRRLDSTGLYGERIAVLEGTIPSAGTPPYMASLTVVLDPEIANLKGDKAYIERIFHSMRPYGGKAWLKLPAGSSGWLSTKLNR